MMLRPGITHYTHTNWQPEAVFPNQRVRVYCSQYASCGWAGYRKVATITAKPCPRCNRDTVIA